MYTYSPSEIKDRLRELHIRPDKFLGQHFLIDDRILEVILEQAEQIVGPGDAIIEIGPGLGVLTNQLLGFPNQVVAIEKDPVLARSLAESLSDPRTLTVIEGDALKILGQPAVPWDKPFAVVANIPYGITSPVIRQLLTGGHRPHGMVLMVQKEVAERITAPAGSSERGLLTVLTEIAAEASIVTSVPKTAFWPEPEVESAVLRIEMRREPLVPFERIAEVLPVVVAGFSAKRRQLHNSLVGGLALTPSTVKTALQAATIDPMRRAEALTISEWAALTDALRASSKVGQS